MQFGLEILLVKLNAQNEVGIDAPKRWQYTHPEKIGVGGFAEVSLSKDGKVLKAICNHWGKQQLIQSTENPTFGLAEQMIEDPEDNVETFELTARYNEKEQSFRIESIIVDGAPYCVDDEGMVELAFSVFYSRSFEIECREIQENFLRNISVADDWNSVFDAAFQHRMHKFPIRNRKMPRMPKIEFATRMVDFYHENQGFVRLAKR